MVDLGPSEMELHGCGDDFTKSTAFIQLTVPRGHKNYKCTIVRFY